jgi:hypothetical protein
MEEYDEFFQPSNLVVSKLKWTVTYQPRTKWNHRERFSLNIVQSEKG